MFTTILLRRNALFVLFSLVVLFTLREPLRFLINFIFNFENPAASQIAVIPFISAGLIYLNRRKIFESVGYAIPLGTLVFVLGLAFIAAAKTFKLHLDYSDELALQIASLVVMWLGGFLFFYGKAAFRAGLFPLLFLFFCVPIPNFILDGTIAFLQLRSADTAYVLLRLSGLPIHRQGVIFVMPDLIIGVEPQCSGIRSGISLCITGLVAGYLLLKSIWTRGLLLLTAIPVLIFKNALRIAVLTLLAIHVDKRILTSALHREGGIPFFVLGLILLTPILASLVKYERAKEESRSYPDKSGRPTWGVRLLEKGNL